MIVVETNVIAGLVLEVRQSDLVVELYQRDCVWCAPALWRSQLRNILATQIRTGRLEVASAFEAMAISESLLAGHEFPVDSVSVLSLAMNSRCTAYDCEFVALAQSLGVPLVTLDRQVLAAFPGTAVALSTMIGDQR